MARAATRLYKERITADCLIGIDELGHNEVDASAHADPDPPAPTPDVRVGASEVVIQTRCPDYGKVDLEVWAGNPGLAPPRWEVVFEGPLKSNGKGFEVGGLATVFHINTAAGDYRVRIEVRRDSKGYVDAVRLIFPDAPNLTGEGRY
jgi:hypothetical protein